MAGGIAHAITLRQTPVLEDSPSDLSKAGIDAGASQVPILDPAARLKTGKTASGEKASRLQAAGELLIDVVGLTLDLHAAAKSPKPGPSSPSPSSSAPKDALDASSGVKTKTLTTQTKALEDLKTAPHTESSSITLEKLESGEYRAIFEPIDNPNVAGTSSGRQMNIDPRATPSDASIIIVHEGHHLQDIEKKIIPDPASQKVKPEERIMAEMRAERAAGEYAKKRGLDSPRAQAAIRRSNLRASHLADEIGRALGHEFGEFIEKAHELFWKNHGK